MGVLTQPAPKLGDPLSAREAQVCELLTQGKTAKQIGAALGISWRTVDYSRTRVFAKMGARNAVHLTAIVLAQKYERNGNAV